MAIKTLKQAMQSLRIEKTENGYELHSPAGMAFYDFWGSRGEVRGIPEYFPTHISIRDFDRESECRSIPCAINVTATPVLWGAKVEWKWPNEANGSWHATFRCEYSDGDKTTYQAGRAKFPDCIHQIAGVPAGKDISLTIRLYDENGRSSEPVPLSTKSSDDAGAILRGLFTGSNGQVFIRDAKHNVRMQIGAITTEEPTADRIREIVSKYLTGEGAEYTDELVEEINSIIRKEVDSTRLATTISETIRERLNKELQPGGLLHKR